MIDKKFKKKVLISLLILALILILSASTYALGIRPAKTELEYTPGIDQKFSFKIINDENLPLDLEAYVVKEISPYIKLEKEEVRIEKNEEVKEFSFGINLPSGLTPGQKVSRVVIGPKDPEVESSHISAKVKLAHKVITFIPPSSGDIDAKLSLEIESDNLIAKADVHNLGDENIDKVSAAFSILEGDETLSQGSSAEKTIKSKEIATLVANLNKNMGNGEYLLLGNVSHEEGSTEFVIETTIGKPEIEIIDLDKLFIEDKINDIRLEIKNNWNKEVEDIKVYSTIIDGTTKLSEADFSTHTLKSRQTEKLQTYLDLRGIRAGEYVLKTKITIGEIENIKEHEIEIFGEEEFAKLNKKRSTNPIIFLISGLGLIIVLLGIIIIKIKK